MNPATGSSRPSPLLAHQPRGRSLGVATAVAVLAGALLVGDSVRGSLRDLVLQRLGRTDRIVVSTGFFREALADDLRGDAAFAAAFSDITPLIVMQGLVTRAGSGRRASRVQVYGVDDRFWRFHAGRCADRARGSRRASSAARSPRTSAPPTAARCWSASSGRRPFPLESLHGRKDDPGRTCG